jgi:hypothetical protein
MAFNYLEERKETTYYASMRGNGIETRNMVMENACTRMDLNTKATTDMINLMVTDISNGHLQKMKV